MLLKQPLPQTIKTTVFCKLIDINNTYFLSQKGYFSLHCPRPPLDHPYQELHHTKENKTHSIIPAWILILRVPTRTHLQFRQFTDVSFEVREINFTDCVHIFIFNFSRYLAMMNHQKFVEISARENFSILLVVYFILHFEMIYSERPRII